VSDELHTLAVDRRDLFVIARIDGEIDASNAGDVCDELVALATGTLIVDLTTVRYLDSAGIAMLDTVRRKADLRLVLTPTSVVARALAITGMTQLVDTYPTVDAALVANGA
jgi:anti-anti-sigma factor